MIESGTVPILLMGNGMLFFGSLVIHWWYHFTEMMLQTCPWQMIWERQRIRFVLEHSSRQSIATSAEVTLKMAWSFWVSAGRTDLLIHLGRTLFWKPDRQWLLYDVLERNIETLMWQQLPFMVNMFLWHFLFRHVGWPNTGSPFLLRETVRMGSLLDMGAGPPIKGKGLNSGQGFYNELPRFFLHLQHLCHRCQMADICPSQCLLARDQEQIDKVSLDQLVINCKHGLLV